MPRKLLSVLILMLAAGCSRPARPAVAERALPDLLVDTVGPFWIRIDRRVSPERAFALLAAERHQPIADSVAQAVARSAHFERRTPYQRGQWWYDGFDNIRIPYAITGDAVRYYLDMFQTFERNGGGGVPGSPRMNSVGLRYVVTVSRADSIPPVPGMPRDGYVVEMTLTWSNGCGDLCALMFGKKRRVWVGEDGRVKAAEGDGVTGFVVS